jgi:hypothetical protein
VATSPSEETIILVHNLPSGDPSPSPEDAALATQAVEAGRLLGIEVLDHIVIGRRRFVSLKDQGVVWSGSTTRGRHATPSHRCAVMIQSKDTILPGRGLPIQSGLVIEARDHALLAGSPA